MTEAIHKPIEKVRAFPYATMILSMLFLIFSVLAWLVVPAMESIFLKFNTDLPFVSSLLFSAAAALRSAGLAVPVFLTVVCFSSCEAAKKGLAAGPLVDVSKFHALLNVFLGILLIFLAFGIFAPMYEISAAAAR